MDNVPTEEELIEAWSHHVCMDLLCSGGCPERFPAMEAIRKIKAQAWHEGFCRGEVSGAREMPLNPYTENPYEEQK